MKHPARSWRAPKVDELKWPYCDCCIYVGRIDVLVEYTTLCLCLLSCFMHSCEFSIAFVALPPTTARTLRAKFGRGQKDGRFRSRKTRASNCKIHMLTCRAQQRNHRTASRPRCLQPELFLRCLNPLLTADYIRQTIYDQSANCTLLSFLKILMATNGYICDPRYSHKHPVEDCIISGMYQLVS